MGFFPDSGWVPVTSVSLESRSGPRSDAVQAAALAGTMQELIDDLPEQIAILNERSDILAVNHAWKDIVLKKGYSEALPGGNYREFCELSAQQGYEPAVEALVALDEIASGKRSFWQLIYNGKERWDRRDFQICIRKILVGAQNLVIVTRFDLTEILELRRLKSEFSHSLLEQQTIERQRLGRELHDSTSQLLAAIGLLLGRLKHQSPGDRALGLVEEMQDLVGEAQQEIRSISYLAHPPSLEKLGLAGAMKSLVEGFARRTGLEASFEIQGELVQISHGAESAIYRLVQEALSNVHRHAHATRIRMLLIFRGSATHFVVADDGVGISADARAGTANTGVGLASMRERLSEIGGRLTIQALSPGTAIIASVREAKTIDVSDEADRTQLQELDA